MLLDWLVGARAVPWEPGREVGQGTHRPAACTTAPALSGQASEESREEALRSKSWEALGGSLTARHHAELQHTWKQKEPYGHAPFTVSAFSRVWQQNRKGSVALNCVHTENRVNKITGTRRSEPFRGPDRRQVSGIQAVTKPWRVIHIPHRLHILCQVSPCPR